MGQTRTGQCGMTAPLMQFASREADEVVHVLSERLAPHRMRLRERSQDLDAHITAVVLGPATLVDLAYGADVDVALSEVTDHYLVHAAVSGTAQVRSGGRAGAMHARNVTITSPGDEPVFQLTAACRHVTVRLARSAVETYFGQALERPITRPVVFGAEAREESDFYRIWRSLVLHLHEQSRLLPHLFSSTALQNHYAATMLELLLRSASHTYCESLERARATAASPWHVRRARALIEARLGEALSVTSLAREVGVSVRSLQSGFRQSLGLTPLEYIRQQRLERLHASLRSADPNASVTDLMLEHGIVNFGRFAQYYRHRYGCRPSDTLRRRSHAV